MNSAQSVLDKMGLGARAGKPAAVRSRSDVLRLCRPLDFGADFLLLLLDEKLDLLGAWKLERGTSGVQGFSTALALRLAVSAKAGGMILVQRRDDGDVIPGRADLRLTHHLREVLEETNVELLDHLLIFGDQVRSAGGPEIGRDPADRQIWPD
jgi:DNA repair protein RadC